MFEGSTSGVNGISRRSYTVTRSISPENFTGEKGGGGKATKGTGAACAAELGIGWKISPSVLIDGNSSFTLADIAGEGCIRHFWITAAPAHWRSLLLKIYWEDNPFPSVSAPLGDFFCNGWGERANVNSLAITVNPAGGFNCYFEMPFRKRARFVLKNTEEAQACVYYQIDYCLTKVPKDCCYFHAQWRRENPVGYKSPYVILDGVRGAGQYVGTYIAWQTNHNGWWGEGEMKFYLDGDKEFPTICGTGTEDYFGGAWNFEQPPGSYCTFSTAYQGLVNVIRPDGLYRANTRFGMYRWHIPDPIGFNEDIKVTLQCLGWKKDHRRYQPLREDVASVAYWYMENPCDVRLSYTAEDYEIT